MTIRQADDLASDLMLDISQGKVQNTTHINKFGRNTDFNATAEDVWDGGGIWVPPTEARIHNIFSNDAEDNITGGGARVVRVFGLVDWDTLETHEDIPMNGVGDSLTTNSYVIIHRMVVIQSGATSINIGTITAEPDIDLTVTAQISPGVGQTQMAVYGWPSIQTAYATRFYTSVNKQSAAAVNLSVFVQLMGGEVQHPILAGTAAVNSDGMNALQLKPQPYNRFEGPAILKIQCQSSSNNTDVSAGFDLILVRNK